MHHEEVASKSWPNQWGFLTTKYEDVSNKIINGSNDTILGLYVQQKISLYKKYHPNTRYATLKDL